MANVTYEQVKQVLAEYQDPYLGTDLVSAHALKNIELADGNIKVQIQLGFPAKTYADELASNLRDVISALAGVASVVVDVSWQTSAHAVQKTLKHFDNIKNIIAIASGKGGVGKSTTAVNLALALAAEGARVGILDADIYGPSMPQMLGITGKPDTDGKGMSPKNAHGIQAMSIGFLVDEDTPMIWRGPMVSQALEQLLRDTRWDDLDYLIIDLPPGTGDTQLTLSQKIPVSGAVIVTTPQDIALLDARKALKMFQKVEVPVLGIVENMSLHICTQCGHEEAIFGSGGGDKMAHDYGITLLGQLPLAMQIREQADNGNPTVVADPNGRIAHIYRDIARKVSARLSRRGRDYAAKFPKIVIQND
ncbi:MAG: iron-sulfur cluster carrier protein ApbC [Gammaproteobacteria bacterium]|nr:iron-sulfur cluster carrier protein ApbC [Gammaproteobacteria bacterium]